MAGDSFIGDFKGRFEAALGELCPAWPRAKFLIAFSGGLDSTALTRLAALSIPPQKLTAAHLNHGLRGQAAQADQLFAADAARGLGLEFITETADVAALANRRGKGVEEAARQARYQFLTRAAQTAGAEYILTAHQADDQAETILMNFIRGAGAGGLAGIHPRRRLGGAMLLRPLLGFSRPELKSFLEGIGQPWAEDHTNQDTRYRRNDLRLTIIPRLKRINPRLTDALGRAGRIRRDEEDFWRTHLKKLWPQIAVEDDGQTAAIAFSRAALEKLTVAEGRRLIYEGFLEVKRRRDWEQNETGQPLAFATVEAALAMLALKDHKGLDLPGGVRAEVTADRLILSPASRFQGLFIG